MPLESDAVGEGAHAGMVVRPCGCSGDPFGARGYAGALPCAGARLRASTFEWEMRESVAHSWTGATPGPAPPYVAGVYEGIRLFRYIDGGLRRPFVLHELPAGFVSVCDPRGIGAADVTAATARELFRLLVFRAGRWRGGQSAAAATH